MHNEKDRVTIIREGSYAITFERVDGKKMFLKYFIDSQVCKGVVVDNDLYIQNQLKHIPSNDMISRDDIKRIELTLSKVSEEDSRKLSRSVNRDIMKNLRPE